MQKSPTDTRINVFISGYFEEKQVIEYGGKVLARFDDVAIVSLPVTAIEKITELDGVDYIEAPKPLQIFTDVSVPETGTTELRNATGLTGAGTIIGVLDTGIDWRHHDFRNSDGTTRIKYLLDLSEPGVVYEGTEYTENDINAALNGSGTVNETDYIGHGTHVAGIAAGDGSDLSRWGKYAGIAPGAELIIVKATREPRGKTITESDQLLAVKYISKKAMELGQPYVINLSLGGQFGPHDGTSAAERALTTLISTGNILVAAAGNQGNDDIHAAGTFSDAVKRISIKFEIDPYPPIVGTDNDDVWFDIWYNGDAELSPSVTTPSGSTFGPVQNPGSRSWNTAEGAIIIQKSGVNANNGDKEIVIFINDNQTGKEPAAGAWSIELSGVSGHFDAWLASSTMEVRIISPLENAKKVSIPGTVEKIITVGAFHTKNDWQDRTNTRWRLQNPAAEGDLAIFSNPGPTRDGRIKPDLVAPGIMIGSTYSRDAYPSDPISIFAPPPGITNENLFILQDGIHAITQGTSMAAPHVTGIIALLLENRAQLTADQVREMLTRSAKPDRFTESLPNNFWGYGKVDASRAIQITPGSELPSEFIVKAVYPNPARTRIKLEYVLPMTGSPFNVTVKIFNVLGQQVRTLRQEFQNAGPGKIFWDGTNENGIRMGSGVYFFEFTAGSFQKIQKLMLLSPGMSTR